MADKKNFPNIKPSSRTYTPGRYPQVEFVAQNGAKTVLRYGDKPVDAKLTLGFTNITDSQANEILDLYEKVNSVYDYIVFQTQANDFQFVSFGGLAGVSAQSTTAAIGAATTDQLLDRMTEEDKLRYRFDGPPTVTSVRPGKSNVQCKFVACLDGD